MTITITGSRLSIASAEKTSPYLLLEPASPNNIKSSGFGKPKTYDLENTFTSAHIKAINDLTTALQDGKLDRLEHPAVQAGLKALAQVHANIASVRDSVLKKTQPDSKRSGPEYFSDANGNNQIKEALKTAPNREKLVAAVDNLDKAIWKASKNNFLTPPEKNRLVQISTANQAGPWTTGASSGLIEFILGNLISGKPFLPGGD